MLRYTFRTLFARKWRLAATGIAIVFGVSFIVGTNMLSATLKSGVNDLISDAYRGIDVLVRSSDAQENLFSSQLVRPPLDQSTLDVVRQVNGVRAADGQVQVNPILLDRSGKRIEATFLPTFAFNWSEDPQLRGGKVSQGHEPVGPDEVVMDFKTANEFGFELGDKVTAQFKDSAATFTLVGIGGVGEDANKTTGSRVLLLQTARIQELAGQPAMFNYISVAAEPGVSQTELRDRIGVVLPDKTEALTGEDFIAETQAQLARLIGLVNNLIGAFGYLSIFVASFVIYNIFSIVVAQRIRELGLLRALGAGRGQMLRAVLAEAMTVGMIAALVGIGVGSMLAAGLKNLLGKFLSLPSGFPPITTNAVVIALIVGVVVTMISALIPALRATRISPMSALRESSLDQSPLSRPRKIVGALMAAGGVALNWYGLTTDGDRPELFVGLGAVLVYVSIIVVGPVFAAPITRFLSWPLPGLRGVPGLLARENGSRNPKRSAATAAAMVVAVSVVVMISVIASSFSSSIEKSFSQGIKADLIVTNGTGGIGGLPTGVAGGLTQVPGVSGYSVIRFAAGRVLNSKVGLEQQKLVAADPTASKNDEGQLGLSGPAGQEAFVLGVDSVTFRNFVDLGKVTPDIDKIPDDSVIVTQSQAETNNWKVGDEVEIWAAGAQTKTFPIAAIYEKGIGRPGYTMSLTTFNEFAAEPFRVDSLVYVQADPNTTIEAARNNVEKYLATPAPAASVEDIGSYIKKQIAVFSSLVNIIYGLLFLAVIVSIIGVANTLALSIHERTREIGLLRAVGTNQAQVRAAVRWEAAVIALFGSLLGVVLGFAFAAAFIATLTNQGISLDVPLTTIVTILVVGTLGGVAASLWPAFRASRINILQAIAVD